MPWRRTRDPYAVWVSEVMLQQTRVEAVTPYYQRWMAQFPTLRHLARAPIDDVLQAWAGLGYYARARRLHAAAREIEARYQGQFPDQPEAVRALPGVGRYTAGAILSIAFGRREPILDGNVERVLSRVFLVGGEGADGAHARRQLWALAASLVPKGAAAEFNQSMMELGASLCRPRGPDCLLCPLRTLCGARRRGVQGEYPAAKRAVAPRVVESATVLLERRGRFLLGRRPPSGLWGGLWEPPRGELLPAEPPADAALRLVREHTGLDAVGIQPWMRFDHALTHRRLRFFAFRAGAAGRLRLNGYDASRWLEPREIRKAGVAAWTKRLFAPL